MKANSASKVNPACWLVLVSPGQLVTAINPPTTDIRPAYFERWAYYEFCRGIHTPSSSTPDITCQLRSVGTFATEDARWFLRSEATRHSRPFFFFFSSRARSARRVHSAAISVSLIRWPANPSSTNSNAPNRLCRRECRAGTPRQGARVAEKRSLRKHHFAL